MLVRAQVDAARLHPVVVLYSVDGQAQEVIELRHRYLLQSNLLVDHASRLLEIIAWLGAEQSERFLDDFEIHFLLIFRLETEQKPGVIYFSNLSRREDHI